MLLTPTNGSLTTLYYVIKTLWNDWSMIFNSLVLVFSVSLLDALRPSERLKFWSGLLPQGNPLKLSINIKYGALISAGSSHIPVSLILQAPELITTFDEHRVSLNFKFGILCQKEGQVWDLRYMGPPHNLSDGPNLSVGHRGGHTQ